MVNNPKIIVTVGPATHSLNHLEKMKDLGVDFIRVNMSHSTTDYLKDFIRLSKKADLPFIIDTQGSQVRTGDLSRPSIQLKENQYIKIYTKTSLDLKDNGLCLKPSGITEKLEPGDLIYIDFNSLVLRVSDVSTSSRGYITAQAISDGCAGNNKAVVIESVFRNKINLPVLSPVDFEAIKIGLREKIGYIAVSFVRRVEDIDFVRKATKNSMKIISKIECVDALKNLDAIVKKTDLILIDRGDLSKEIPLTAIPMAQKMIMNTAKKYKKDVFVATNLLETMISSKKPTRAEVNDIANTILDGAAGLALAAETAIGKYPLESIATLKKVISHTISPAVNLHDGNSLITRPHGGKLVNLIPDSMPSSKYLASLKKVKLDPEHQMDVELMGVGVYSPLEGFMIKKDLDSVADKMRLANGTIWPLPIVLDVSKEESCKFKIGDAIALMDSENSVMAILHLAQKYPFNKKRIIKKIFGTDSIKHPGVKMMNNMKDIFIGGKIEFIKKRNSETKGYELTPAQVRKLIEEKGWLKVIGFHTRNVIHRSHEFIQLGALRKEFGDGLFVHPIIGKKKPGDFNAKYIIRSYETMMKNFYPKDSVIFSVFSSYSRYAGPREALFTAICRKNYGCSHFIVGRDHTGVGDFYKPTASHDIFDKFPDLGIKPVKFHQVFYSKKLDQHMHEKNVSRHDEKDKLHISGTQARKMFLNGKIPPSWFMRPEISKPILTAIKRGEKVFVKNAVVVWFTGLSGSGKTTIATALSGKLSKMGKKVLMLDGDEIRKTISKDLGFSRDDIRENNKRIAELAKSKMGDYDFILVPVISPLKEDRLTARKLIGDNFVELFVNASLEKCKERDVKGLYGKYAAGLVVNLIGASSSSSYECPENPDIEINTEDSIVNKNINQVIKTLNKKKII
ncbi:MAG: hypothetical protein A3G51_02585 [Candidatus Yanofskybacteria bacterium RIFCSPLOWO2_12_FULL_43_11b]|uniref:Pyruvate kinase n=1 Tax=Candidatus Yanofskybacteria bacterium RIFCSPLOWO2_12_FULL_43_11b TaxID=1802710 RepID=A0A1F8H7H6_9BACT|nr:MAG: hypothetical protein A3G51_02585 [Candidatus Yanofskybacteria bacterium RIFCSPLOWO2_12_FULL_43_11b]